MVGADTGVCPPWGQTRGSAPTDRIPNMSLDPALGLNRTVRRTSQGGMMATTQRETVVGVFDNRAEAEKAVEELHRAGFRDSEIGYAAHGDEMAEGGTNWQTAGPGEAGEGAAKGAVGGGIIGAILG